MILHQIYPKSTEFAIKSQTSKIALIDGEISMSVVRQIFELNFPIVSNISCQICLKVQFSSSYMSGKLNKSNAQKFQNQLRSLTQSTLIFNVSFNLHTKTFELDKNSWKFFVRKDTCAAFICAFKILWVQIQVLV